MTHVQHYTPGPTGMRILARAASEFGFFQVDTPQECDSALKLHCNGLLDRHPKISRAYALSIKGRDYLVHHNGEKR
jgi:hypothetical protein